MTNVKLNIGKLRSTGSIYPWEPGYVAAIQSSCKQLEAIIKDCMSQFTDATPQIVLEALEPTFEKSKMYCPKDTGALVNSGYLESVGFRGQPRIEMGYARGGQPFYAVLVHENLEARHQAPTQAKWLERAVNEDYALIFYRIADGMRSFLGGPTQLSGQDITPAPVQSSATTGRVKVRQKSPSAAKTLRTKARSSSEPGSS